MSHSHVFECCSDYSLFICTACMSITDIHSAELLALGLPPRGRFHDRRRNMIFGEKFLTHFFCSRVCSEIWGDPNPGATFKCFPNCRSRPRGNNSFCKWANIAEDIFGLIELGWWIFLEQPVLVTLSCFLRQNQFNQRQLNDLILKRQLSLGSRSSRSPGPYKHPNPPYPGFQRFNAKINY